ncbi:MAG: prepilin-type N-terminal cleavage/methylation domain-containing protein [bacterium]|nr:prepilin-type N-terminal cleavage/methylation domain-containing protein [bacterium]
MKKGFTLIELLIYVALTSAVVVAFISFSLTMFQARSKAAVHQEINANARFAMEYITDAIRGSSGVNLGGSTFSSDPGVLELSMADVAKNPTVIELTADNGQIQITEGATGPIIVMPTLVSVTNLQFTNLTGNGRVENVRVQMTLQYSGTDSAEYATSQTYQTAVSVRR